MSYEYKVEDMGNRLSRLEDTGNIPPFMLEALCIALALVERLEEIARVIELLNVDISTR